MMVHGEILSGIRTPVPSIREQAPRSMNKGAVRSARPDTQYARCSTVTEKPSGVSEPDPPKKARIAAD